MKTFVFYVRAYLGNCFFMIALITLPESRYKRELIELIYGLKHKVINAVNEARKNGV